MNTINRVLVNIAFGTNILLLFILLFEHRVQDLSPGVQVLGRLHPMVLHFPVALLFVIFFLELYNRYSKPVVQAHTQGVISFLLSLSAMSAALVALMGFLLFHSGGYEGPDMFWHKWTGVGVSMLAGILVWLKRNYPRGAYWAGLIASLVMVTAAGHYGAALTHGSDFVTEPLRKNKTREITNIDSAVVFTDFIQPILETKCVGCHNPNKKKGELMLVDKESILKGGENGKVLVPGSPDSSALYSFLLLPMKDDRHMPPEGKVQLEPDEIRLIHWWIASGADFEQLYVQAPRPDSIRAIVGSMFKPLSPLDKLNIAFVSPDKIKSYNNPSRGVRQVSASRPYIEVYLANRKDLSATDLQELEDIRQQVVSINLSNSKVEDDIAKELLKFPHVQRLYLENTGVTNKGVQELSALKFLEYINLSGTEVDEEIATVLSRFPSLQYVYLFETPVVKKGPADMQKNLPGVKVGLVPVLDDSLFVASLALPAIEIDSLVFSRRATLAITPKIKKTKIYYTTDGSDPSEKSAVYTDTLRIDSSCTFKAVAMLEGWENSSIATYQLRRSSLTPVASMLISTPDSQYVAKRDTSLLDRKQGTTDISEGGYVGHTGADLQLMADLGSEKTLSAVGVSCLEMLSSLMVRPTGIEIFGGEDKDHLRRIGVKQIALPDSLVRGVHYRVFTCKIDPVKVRFVKVVARHSRNIPSWYKGNRKKALLLIDEVTFE